MRRSVIGYVPCSMLFLLVAAVPSPRAAHAADNSIVPAGSTLERLYTRTAPIPGGQTEGPAAAPDGSIYFTDIPYGVDKGLILRFDPETQSTTVFASDSHKSNGLAFDAQGTLIGCEGSDHGGRRVSRWNVKTGARETVADTYMGKRFSSPNDLCIDAKGRIYFTDPGDLGTEPGVLDLRAVYRIDTDGSVVEITHDVEKPNGLALSPNQQTLYVIDHNNGTERLAPSAPPKKGAMKVYAFPLGPDGRVAGSRSTLIDFGAEDGCDGMSVDVQGNLYLACRDSTRPGILVLDPNGKELAYIPTGRPQPGVNERVGFPTNCEFGTGDESNVLYITVDKSLYRIRLKINGYHTSRVTLSDVHRNAR